MDYKYSNKTVYIIFGCFMVLWILTGFLLYENNQYYKMNEGLMKICERCRLYDDNNLNNTFRAVNGIYNNGKYYCVWTENRTLPEIYNTTAHEICHDLVFKKTKHFCGYYYK